jgi:hypothetical protein
MATPLGSAVGARAAEPLHVFGGDCAAEVAERAGLPGRVLAWRDSAAVGPCALDPAVHRRLRAEWWEVAEERIQLPGDLRHHGEIVLWFGPDPWEQIALVEVLGGAPGGEMSLVDPGCAVGLMAPGDLPPLLAERVEVGSLRRDMRALWPDFCRDDRPALASWAQRLAREPRLPHLGPALARVLEDREHGRTEGQVRALVAQGIHDLPDLMAALASLEHPSHGVWYGDAVVGRIRDRLLAGRS